MPISYLIQELKSLRWSEMEILGKWAQNVRFPDKDAQIFYSQVKEREGEREKFYHVFNISDFKQRKMQS